MLDTLYIGTSGLLSHAKGLRVVGNNLANVNTPGFKSAQLQFGALFEQGGGSAPAATAQHALGRGVDVVGTRLLLKAGNEQGTGNPLDLSINGNGMFVVRRDDKLMYTRSGDFQFNAKNELVNGAGDRVQALDANGKLGDVTLNELARNPAKATSTVKLSGNLPAPPTPPATPSDTVLNGVTVIDAAGASHAVNLVIKSTGVGSFSVTVSEAAAGGGTLGSGTIKFNGLAPDPANSVVSFNYAATGVPAFAVKLDFSAVNSLLSPSTLSASQDGYLGGVRADQSIGADGTINVRYSNGQTGKGQRLALADFQSEQDLDQVASGLFVQKGGNAVHYGLAGVDAFGNLQPGRREGSNVDLAEEFGNLILMQRGYQASSHVISTANDMIQQLFDMKGNR